jgi:hypothetical protein
MTYLIQYGRLSFVGNLLPAQSVSEGVRFSRGDRVVIRGPRGLEIGTILVGSAPLMPIEGEIVRIARPDDFAAAERQEALGQEILAAAEAVDLPISFIDIEVSLDGQLAILHGLPWSECDAAPLVAELSERFGLSLRLLDLSQTPTLRDPPDPEKATCGKADCGTGTGGCSSCASGCSTGSCSKGAVKSAEELSEYFTGLRRKMEASGLVRTPLA